MGGPGMVGEVLLTGCHFRPTYKTGGSGVFLTEFIPALQEAWFKTAEVNEGDGHGREILICSKSLLKKWVRLREFEEGCGFVQRCAAVY
jgi:hypothetical protein